MHTTARRSQATSEPSVAGACSCGSPACACSLSAGALCAAADRVIDSSATPGGEHAASFSSKSPAPPAGSTPGARVASRFPLLPMYVAANAKAVARIDALLVAAAAASAEGGVKSAASAEAIEQLRILSILQANLAGVLGDEDNTVVNAEGVAVRGRDILAALTAE